MVSHSLQMLLLVLMPPIQKKLLEADPMEEVSEASEEIPSEVASEEEVLEPLSQLTGS